MQLDFSGKVVLVTGASAGIGEATAILFAKYGAKLSLVGKNEQNLRNVAKRCEDKRGVKTLAIEVDISTDEGCEAAAKQTIEHFGRLDVLVNNAGITARSRIEQADMATFDKVFNINVRAVYNLTRLLVPALVESKGNIINISSVSGTGVFVGTLPYSLSKAALDHFTRLTSLELAPKGVRVNAVSPGVTVSSIIISNLNFTPEQYAKYLVDSAAVIPMGEVCQASDVASTVVFLASDYSRLTTGIVMPVDGGIQYGNMSMFGKTKETI